MEETLNRITEYIDIIHPIAICAIMFGLAFLQYIFPPVPSDTLLIAVGIIASSDLFMGLEMLCSYILGAIAGSALLYEICMYFGNKVQNLKIVKNMIEGDNLEKAKKNLEKYGGISFFFLRFVPTMPVVTVIAFGLTKIRRERVYLILILVGILGSVTYTAIGFLLGDNLPLIDKLLERLGILGWVILGAIIVTILCFYIIFKIKNKKQN